MTVEKDPEPRATPNESGPALAGDDEALAGNDDAYEPLEVTTLSEADKGE